MSRSRKAASSAAEVSGEGGTVTMPDGSRGAMLRAYDKKTGAEVGAVAMPARSPRIAAATAASR